MSEATMWAKRGAIPLRKARVWNAASKEWETPVDDEGRPLMERVPQSGKVGLVRQVADIDGLRPMRERRFIAFLHADGNVCNDVIRGAAASEPGSDRSFEAYVRAKAKHHGWIEQGACPVDEAMRRNIFSGALVAKENKDALAKKQSCPVSELGAGRPPCAHFIAEEVARKARRSADSERREEAHRSAADRQTDALVDLVSNLNRTTAPAKPGKRTEPGE